MSNMLAKNSVSAAIDIGKEKVSEIIGELIAHSESSMSAALSEIQRQAPFRDQIFSEFAAELKEAVPSVSTLDDVERRFIAAEPTQRPTLSDAANTTNEVVKQLVRSTSRKKRALLAAALVNSFDPAIYAAGATSELLEILERLSPTDVRTLEGCEKQQIQMSEGDMLNSPHYTSAIKLLDLRLVRDLRGSGVSRFGSQSSIYATDLGKRLLALLRGHTAG
jgi:hypothetical protein